MTTPTDSVFNALAQPAAQVGRNGVLLALNAAWRAQRPWGIDRPGGQLGDLCPQLIPLRHAVSQPNAPLQTLDTHEPFAPDTEAPPRHWHLQLTSIDTDTALLVARDVTDARTATHRLEAVIQDQTELICRFKPDTTLTFVNTAYCAFFHTTPDKLLGRQFLDFVPKNLWPIIQKRLADLSPDQRTAEYEHPVKRLDGTDGWQTWTDRAFFDHRGRVIEFQSVGRDITDQKRIEAELQSRRQETQLILDNIPALVWFKDRTGRILRLNQQAADLVGRPPAQIEGRHSIEFFPENASQYQSVDDAVFASGQPRLGIVEPITDHGGNTRWYRTDKVPLKVQGDRFDRILAMSIDVTDLVRAEERIRESEARFRGLFDRVPAAVFEHDLSGSAALVQELKETGITNPQAHLEHHPDIVGEANRRALIRGMNQPLLDLFEATNNTEITDVFRRGGMGDNLKIGRKMLMALWRGASSIKFETTGFTRTGRPLDLLFRMDLPRDADDQPDPSRALISLTDLTERTRRIFDQARVEQAAEERRDLGHELHDRLGQQLTGLNMLCATLHRRMAARGLPESQDVAELGGLIKEANLEVRRVISGLSPEPITAQNLITALTSLRDNIERTQEVSVSLRFDPPPAELTDEQANHLLMIAGEAAHNAGKHGKPKHIHLTLLTQNNNLLLEIADDGLGLNPSTSPPGVRHARSSNDPRQFSRDHPEFSHDTAPTGGRGLHIMRYRARQIGATIQFDSPQGAGTTVRCVLPLGMAHVPLPDMMPAPPDRHDNDFERSQPQPRPDPDH